MKRLPLIPTLIVGLAIAAMVSLGIWQLRRADEKAAALAVYTANINKPAIAYPALAPVSDEALFRLSSANCPEVIGWRTQAGRSTTGQSGYRFIAECRTGAEGPGLLVDMGVGANPRATPDWKGGLVEGRITTEPQHASLFGQLFRKAPPARPMLIASTAPPGLAASQPPAVADIPNNHIAYAGQWFFFAAVAAVIYVLALRRRRTRQ